MKLLLPQVRNRWCIGSFILTVNALSIIDQWKYYIFKSGYDLTDTQLSA